MIITVLAVSPHVHEYGSKQSYLTPPTRFYLDTSIQTELEELKFLLSASNTNRAFIYINEDHIKELGLTEEEAPPLPISHSTPSRTVEQTLEELTRVSEPEGELVTPTPIEQIIEDIVIYDLVPDTFDSNSDPEIHEAVAEAEDTKAEESQPEVPSLEDPKEARTKELEALEWKKVKVLATSYKIVYVDKPQAIKQILDFEF